MSAPKLVTSFSGLRVQIQRLTLGADQAGVEQRQGVRPTCTHRPDPFRPVMMLSDVDGLRLLTADARPHAEQAVGRVGPERAVVRDAVREDVADRDFEGDREDIEAGEHVLARRAARAGDAAEIVAVQVDQIEDSLLIELIGIVELAGDDPPAVRQRMNVRVDERLIVETHFAAGGVAGVVALERTETVDEPIGLRAVVVREDGQIPAQDRARRRHRIVVAAWPVSESAGCA